MTIVCQNLTDMTYLQFFDHNATSQVKSILETIKTSFASYSLIQLEKSFDRGDYSRGYII